MKKPTQDTEFDDKTLLAVARKHFKADSDQVKAILVGEYGSIPVLTNTDRNLLLGYINQIASAKSMRQMRQQILAAIGYSDTGSSYQIQFNRPEVEALYDYIVFGKK